MKNFSIVSINISNAVGVSKTPVPTARLVENHGIDGDAHAGAKIRQVSLLASEEVDAARLVSPIITYGSYAENIDTRGIDLAALPVGTRLYMGDAVLEVSQIGKKCHTGCAIGKSTGECVMPKKGIFAIVITGGEISATSPCSCDTAA